MSFKTIAILALVTTASLSAGGSNSKSKVNEVYPKNEPNHFIPEAHGKFETDYKTDGTRNKSTNSAVITKQSGDNTYTIYGSRTDLWTQNGSNYGYNVGFLYGRNFKAHLREMILEELGFGEE